MSQLPQNNEAFDNNPEYTKLYQANNSVQPSADDPEGQILLESECIPALLIRQKGEKAESLSSLFGVLSVASIPIANGAPYFIFISLVLGILGIWQGRVAKRHGVPALAGRILSWASAIFTLPLAFVIALFLIAVAGRI